MNHKRYGPEEVLGLLPLLGSIGREIEERTEVLEELEARLEELSESGSVDRDLFHGLIAEAAAHRRGIRLARQELERLGCSVVGTEPLTFRIPGLVGKAKKSFVWQKGDLALKG